MKRQTVVAHYNEDLSWLTAEYEPLVYTKGNDCVPGHRFHYLFNVGREAHTYLYHVCRHYGELADVTLFCQGGMADHLPYPDFNPVALLDIPEMADVSGMRLCKGIVEWDSSGRLVTWGRWAKMSFDGSMRLCQTSFAAWWKKTLGEDLVPSKGITYFPGAIFCARKEVILRRPREFYRDLLGQLEHVNPEEAHFLERAWLTIFQVPTDRVAHAS